MPRASAPLPRLPHAAPFRVCREAVRADGELWPMFRWLVALEPRPGEWRLAIRGRRAWCLTGQAAFASAADAERWALGAWACGWSP